MGKKGHDREKLPHRWSSCDIEEEHFGEDRKANKIERKIYKAKDRSKYKKTDQRKLQKVQRELDERRVSDETQKRGRVLSIVPQGIIVEFEGHNYTCGLRGTLKQEKGLLKNLVTVGDFVLFAPTSQDEGMISYVEPRKSVLSRADNLSRRKEQLIAANIDQVFITASVVDPPIKSSLIDRYVIAAQKGNMEPIIIVNKIDLLNGSGIEVDVEIELFQEVLSAYAKAGIKVIPFSVETGKGLDLLQQAMKDKVSVFSGQSGVGKTSIINKITGLNLRIGRTVERTKKGAHTTSSTQLLPLEFGGWCIDTPGIKSFGVWDLEKDEIEGYFSEIHEAGLKCKFPDCSHLHEKECAVLKALEQGKISELRYESYQALIDSVSADHLRR